MDGANAQSFPEVEILGIYMSAAAAAGVWILKAIGDHASKKKKQQNSTRENLITRMLWNYSPAGGRSTITTLTAWWRLVLVGLLVVGLFPMFLSPIIGKEESVVTAIGAISLWILYLVWYALKHVLLEGSGSTPSGGKDQKRRLNVTIVTGFLGCGKTTLVNHILNNDRGKRILVIENEVGEAGIDNELLIKDDKEEIILMNNGCICCSVRGDLVKVFHALFDRGSFKALDWVVIETTGIADPAPVAQTLYMDERCRKELVLDAVVAVADCRHLPQRLAAGDSAKAHGGKDEAVQQLAFADRILLNKVDLVTDDELASVRELVASLSPQATLIECTFAEVPIEQVVGLKAFDADRVADSLATAGSAAAGSGWANKGGAQTGGGAGVRTVTLRGGDMHMGRFNDWLLRVLQSKGQDIFRFKGIISMSGHDERFVVQGMHMLSDGKKGSSWAGAERNSKMVFIGKGIKAADFEEGFMASQAKDSDKKKAE